MNRILAIIIKNLKQLSRQYTALAMVIIGPLISFAIFSFIFKSKDISIELALHNAPQALIKILEEEHENFRVETFLSEESMVESLSVDDNAIGLSFNNNTLPNIYIATISFQKNELAIAKITKLLSKLNMSMAYDTNKKHFSESTFSLMNIKENAQYIYPIKNFTAFETMGPGLLGVMIMFFVFVSSAMAFLSEKNSGTLERILISPLKIYELIIGYFASFTIVAFFQVSMFSILYMKILKLSCNGSFIEMMIVSMVIAFMAISTGMLISSFAKTEFQVMQSIPLILVPQIAISGLFDLSNAGHIINTISNYMPMTYAVRALSGIILKDNSLFDVSREIIILMIFGFALLFVNYLFLMKYKPRIRRV